MNHSEHHQRAQRQDPHPWITKIRALWMLVSSVFSIGLAVFVAFGFEFKTPATWLQQNTDAVNKVAESLDKVTGRVDRVEDFFVILARDACNRMTPPQLLVTPQCDEFIVPQRRQR